MRPFLLFCFLIFIQLTPARATHIVGGELTYKCLGNNNYEFTLVVFRDCYTGQPWFDTIASVGVFDENWNLVKEIRMKLDSTSNDTLPIVLSNPCLIAPPDVCAHGTRYKTVVNLPYRPGGYRAVYQRCCRNQLIRNIVRPLRTGISIVSEISEQALQECNNSAVFNQWPPVAICVHEPIDFDHSATDIDGDSLVYRLCTPLDGADSTKPMPQPPNPATLKPVLWKDPYNLSNVLGGTPLTIDPATGFLTGIPNTIGNFVVGVCVDEYRGGEIISTTRRDFQYNVADCGTPDAALFVQEKNCLGAPVFFVNQSDALTYTWYFDWENDPGLKSSQHSPQYTYPDTGSYTVALIASPGTPCADTAFKTIYVGLFRIDADIAVDLPTCDNNGLTVLAFDKSVDSLYGVAAWQWRLTGPNNFVATSPLQNATFLVTRPGSYNLRLVATSAGGCRDTANYQFVSPIPRTDSLRAQVLICPGDSVRLNAGAPQLYDYHWSPPETLSDTAIASPWAFPLENTDYFVTITNAFCVFEGMVSVLIVDTSFLQVSADPTEIYVGESSQLNAEFLPGYTIAWSPSSSLSAPKIPNPVAMPTETTTYTARVSVGNGCTLERSVTIRVAAPQCDEPFLFFPTGFSPNGDGENDELKLEGRYVESVYWAIYNRWGQLVFETSDPEGAWDGTYKGEPQPAETYGYFLRLKCPGGQETFKKGNVTLLR